MTTKQQFFSPPFYSSWNYTPVIWFPVKALIFISCVSKRNEEHRKKRPGNIYFPTTCARHERWSHARGERALHFVGAWLRVACLKDFFVWAGSAVGIFAALWLLLWAEQVLPYCIWTVAHATPPQFTSKLSVIYWGLHQSAVQTKIKILQEHFHINVTPLHTCYNIKHMIRVDGLSLVAQEHICLISAHLVLVFFWFMNTNCCGLINTMLMRS